MKKNYLKYKDEAGNIYNDLIGAVRDMKENTNFDINKFYEKLNKVIIKASEDENFQTIKEFPRVKAEYYFGTLYYFLLEFFSHNELETEFKYLSQFINYQIDVLVIVNYLREN